MVTVLLLPSSARLVLVPDAHDYYSVGIGLADVALAAVLVLAVVDVVRDRRALRSPLVRAAMVFTALVVLAFLRHPSAQGVQTLFHIGAAIALAAALRTLNTREERRLLLVAIAFTVVTQTALSALQVATGDLLVAYAHDPLIRVGGFIRSAGTFPDSFVLAGYALVLAMWLAAYAHESAGGVWIALVGAAAAPVGYTFSRAAALGLAAASAPIVTHAVRSARSRWILVVLLGVPALAALVTRGGWTARTDEYPVEASADRRIELITQTFTLIRRDLVFGIGPGNTVAELRAQKAAVPGSVDLIQPPHDVPYLIALEAGIPAALAALVLAAFVAARALRRGPYALGAFLSLMPYLLLDNYPWTAAVGLPLLGLWAAASLGPVVDPDGAG